MPGPGVIVRTATRSGPTPPLRAPSGQYFTVGLAERGPLVPTLVRSMTEYRTYYGDRVPYGFLYDDLSTFFEEGGAQAWVVRIVGPGATTGNVVLDDGSATNTLRVEAASPGIWSGDLEVEVLPGITAATFRIQVRYQGDLVVDEANLSSPGDAVTRLSGNPYVTVVDLGSATAAPGNNPATGGGRVALTAGNDDRAGVTADRVTRGLDQFDIGLGDGAVGIPGYGPLVHDALMSHARDNRRIAILAGDRGDDLGTLQGYASGRNSEYSGLFAPHVLIPNQAGGTRVIDPTGYIAAVRNRAHEGFGPFRAAAGALAEAQYVVGLDQIFTKADADTLDESRINVIRQIAGTVRNYGWRSLSLDQENYSLLTGRDMLNRLVTEAERALEPFVFESIDGAGRLFARVQSALVSMIEPMRTQGGIYERMSPDGVTLADPGYKVIVDSTVNPLETVARNELHAVLAFRVSPTGQLITLSIIKVGVTGSL